MAHAYGYACVFQGLWVYYNLTQEEYDNIIYKVYCDKAVGTDDLAEETNKDIPEEAEFVFDTYEWSCPNASEDELDNSWPHIEM